MKHQAATIDDKSRILSQVAEALRGDVSDMAMDIGREELLKEAGLTLFTEALRNHIFQKKEAEAKVLYKH